MQTRRWCFRPRPEKHELLSSWLHRLALANATRDHTLCKTMLPDVAIWNRDPDRSFDAAHFPVLSSWTGLTLHALEQMTLGRWAGVLSEEIAKGRHSPWILPVGVYHRIRRREGLLFCPACLREGQADALWMWRMAWSVCCRRHRVGLLAACPSCGAPYMPHRSAPSLLGRMPCSGCGFDLAKANQVVASDWEREFQQRLETAMLTERARIHGIKLFSLPFFYGLRVIVALLLSRRGRDAMGVLIGRDKVPGAKAAIFELRSFEERRSVMRACWELLEDWPDRFLRIAHRAGVRRYDMERSVLMRPFWIESAFDHLPVIRQRRLSEEEVKTIGNWLLEKGEQPTWLSILMASGVGTPVRVPQTALRAYVSGLMAHENEADRNDSKRS